MNGTIKTKTDRGFGFISREGEVKDLFFHSNDLVGVTFDELQIGAAVTFDIVESEKGPAAKNIKLVQQGDIIAKRVSKKRRLIISVVLFCLTFFLLSINSNKPYSGVHDWNGARNGNIARNYLRYGLLETKLGQIENSGQVSSKDFKYYTHFPPTLTLLIAGSFKIFGVTEWAGRLIPILATSGVIVLIFLVGEKLLKWEVGLFLSCLIFP